MNKNISVVNPLLTKLAYDNRFQNFAGFTLFPLTTHTLNVGQIAKFKERYVVQDSRRAFGARSIRIEDYPDSYVNFVIEERSLERAFDDREWMNALDPVKAKVYSAQSKLKFLQNKLGLEIELKQASIATDINNYDSANYVILSGTSQWNDYVNSDPISVIETAKEKVASVAGVPSNQLTCLISQPVYSKLRSHPKILSLLSGMERRIVSETVLQEVLEFKKLVIGTAKVRNGNNIVDVWGKDMIIAYVPDNVESLDEAVFGATIRQEGYPKVETYRDEAASSEVLRYKDALEPVVIDNATGYLIKNCIA